MKYTLRDTIHWKFIQRNIVDFLGGFLPLDQPERTSTGSNILIFNWRDTKHRFSGGAEVYIHELAKRWVKEGHQVTLFCGNDSTSVRDEVIDGVYIVRRGGFYFVYIWAFLYYMLRFRGKYDVVIDSQNGIPFFTPLYVSEPIYSLLFHVHQEVFRKSLIKPLSDIASFLEKNCMPYFYEKTPFLTISESTRDEMIKIGLGKKGITIIHPGVDLTRLHVGKKSSKPTILYLGRLKFYKRVDIFLRAAKNILQKHPNATFIIAGDGEYKKNLKDRAKRMGLDGKILFLGKVSEKQKITLYQKAWTVINPSMMEGWGITTIEANACGTPVLASDVPGLRDSVKHGVSGFLFEHANVDELTATIHKLLTNSQLRNSLSHNARKWAERFDWDKSAKDCLSILTNKERKYTLTIAIPAFNEEKAIKQLVLSYLNQKGNHFTLQKIFVVSDGSTDDTSSLVKSIKDKRVVLLDDGKRLGKSARMNQIKQLCRSEVLLLSDADITIQDDELLERIFHETDMRRAGLVAVKAVPLPARTFFERCINHSVFMQNFIRKRWNGGTNYLSFRGCFLLLHKNFYKKTSTPANIVNNDAFLYFKAKEEGMAPIFHTRSSIFYRSPASFSDHLKQTSRYQHGVKELSSYFSFSVGKEYSIPKILLLSSLILYALKNPILFSGYLIIFLRSKFTKHTPIKKAWNIAVSTKTIS